MRISSGDKAMGGTLIIRPDSGNPPDVVLKALQILERKVGMEKNLRGFKVLPKHFRLIQGDGVNEDSIQKILTVMHLNGYSASNIAQSCFALGTQAKLHMTATLGDFALIKRGCKKSRHLCPGELLRLFYILGFANLRVIQAFMMRCTGVLLKDNTELLGSTGKYLYVFTI